MWARIKAIFRSLFGWAIRNAENPDLLLKQYMDDMRAKIPKLNASVAQVIKYEKTLDLSLERLVESIETLTPRIEIAVRLGEDKKTLAQHLIRQLNDQKEQKAALEIKLSEAKINSANALQRRDLYEVRIRKKIDEAKAQLSRSKQAEAEEQMANVLMSFEVGDETDILDRVTEMIDDKMATSAAKQEVGSESLEGQLLEVEEELASVDAKTSYREFQEQLGLVEPTSEPAERTMEAVPEPTERTMEVVPEPVTEQEA